MYLSNIQEQKQVLSAKQIYSLEVLAMDFNELETMIYEEYTENPLLEFKEQEQDDSAGNEELSFRQTSDTFIRYSSSREKPEFHDRRASGTSLKNYLLLQLYSMPLTPLQRKIIMYLIESLDEDGFLTIQTEEICFIQGWPISAVRECVEIVQSLEPAGVGAFHFRHALVLQAKRKNIYDFQLDILINEYLPDISAGRINKICRQTKISRKKIETYIKYIQELDPRPCRGLETCFADTGYIIPDIVLHFEQKEWNIVVNKSWRGDISINRFYQDHCDHTNDGEMQNYLKHKMDRAKFIIECIEKRRETLLRITTYIIKKHHKFLLGKGTANSVSAKEAAKELGMNPSTISRAIKNKYVQTPIGIFPLKYFFEKNGFMKTNGENIKQSPESIKKRISEVINKETNVFYSDDMLVKLFAHEDISISRRTVAKYRKELNIKNVYERRRRKR